MRPHLLVTNDFPPKVGGIQAYLWELWRRLPSDAVAVMTTRYKGAAEWDAAQSFRIKRVREPVLLPRPGLARAIDRFADEVGAELVMIDPALPLGWIGPYLSHPYGVVVHGAEVTVPGRLPIGRQVLRRVLRGAKIVIAAGSYSADEAERAAGRSLPVVNIAPGVDTERFVPLDASARAAARERLALGADAPVVVAVSRLVPRKGFDVVIRACSQLEARHRGLTLVVGGSGRDRRRLERLARRLGSNAVFLGRFDERDKAALYGLGDVFAMPCRERWNGLEQEGFGIVFVEAAAAGVPQIAGRSGGAAEAVSDGVTGIVVDEPSNVDAVAAALDALLSDADLRRVMSEAGRNRVEQEFAYDVLADRLKDAFL